MWNDYATKKTVTQSNFFFIMSLDHATAYANGGQSQIIDTEQFVSSNFAEFLLDNANNGNEILAVLDDIVEVQTAL